MDAALPDNPVRNGFIFKGWNGQYKDVLSNSVVRATYVESNSSNIFMIESVTAINDSEFTVMLSLTGTVLLCDFDISVFYDPDVLEVVSLNSDLGFDVIANHIAEDNETILNFANASNKSKGKDILEITLRVKNGVTTTDTV